MKNTYRYSCKVEINDKNTLKELYDYLRHYKYVVDKPYQSVGKYLANILVTVNDKRWLSYYLYYKEYEGYAVLNSDGETEYTVKTDKNDDEVLDFSDKKLVTASDNAITVYPFENGGSDKASVTSAALSGAVRYEFGEDVIRASFLSDGQLLVVTKSAGSGCRTFLYD